MFFAAKSQSVRDSAGRLCVDAGSVYTESGKSDSLPGGQAIPTSFKPCQITASVRCEGDSSLLVVLQQDAPWWRVKVDGRLVSKILVDGLFIGLHPGKGNHTLEIEYVNPWINRAVGLAAFGWIFIFGTIAWQFVRFYVYKRKSMLRGV
jgi:hypothetical protein